MEKATIPEYALNKEMFPKMNDSRTTYGRTTMFSACVPGPKNQNRLLKLNMGNSKLDPYFHKGCSINEVLMEVIVY